MTLNWHVVKAVFKRDFKSYFASPTGYVFITLFIFMSAIAAFWPERFFLDNLVSLHHLNALMPYLLLFFIPALTMNSWAGEKDRGTDELLLTLPVSDIEVIIGKYLAVLGIYTASLGFALSHVVVLMSLGSPDLGVMFGTYLGYWLMGAVMLSMGLVASTLTSNATIAFIFGAGLCSLFVFADKIGGFFFSGGLQDFCLFISIPEQFNDLGKGRLLFSTLIYSFGTIAFFLFVNLILVNRRHWVVRPKLGVHLFSRAVCVLITVISLTSFVSSFALGNDLTQEGLHTLSDETHEVISKLDSERPVFIEAFISPKVPKNYVETRENLITTLKEFDRMGGQAIRLNLLETEKYTEEARRAADNYGITPRTVISENSQVQDIYISVAMACGPNEDVIHFDLGLSIEYELTRSVRVVADTERKVIGVLSTDAKLNGGFDMQTFQRQPQWSVVTELKRQYKVISVSPDQPLPKDLDALLVAMPSSLTQKQMDKLRDWIHEGLPTLMLCDPLPGFNPQLAPAVPRGQSSNPFQQQRGPKKEPKGNIEALVSSIGVDWDSKQVIWQKYNPHPEFPRLPSQYVFMGAGSGAGDKAFNADHIISSELQEVLFMFGGAFRKRTSTKNDVTVLMSTSRNSGHHAYNQLMKRTMFGNQLDLSGVNYFADADEYATAVEVKGPLLKGTPKPKDAKKDDKAAKKRDGIHVVLIADVDMISEQFFQIRRQGVKNLKFDNITFVLNAVDVLCQDTSFIDLRKKRVKHRTLSSLEAKTREFQQALMKEEETAEAEAKKEQEAAQKRFDKKLADIDARQDLDRTTKSIMKQTVQEVEERRLAIQKTKIDEKKKAAVQSAQAKKEIAKRGIESGIRLYAVLLPPFPALLLAIFVLIRRRMRENLGAVKSRMRSA